MALPILTNTLVFIVCHGGPADHFATFAQHLKTDMTDIKFCASGPAIEKLQKRQVQVDLPFSTEDEKKALAAIEKVCETAAVIITDVGHLFDIKIQETLKEKYPHIFRLAYYDNPEPWVPGGYSEVAGKVMQAANRVLLANSNLRFDALSDQVGIGYYPIHQGTEMATRRSTDRASMRQKLFSNRGLKDEGQKVLVYFGGNNQEYFEEAFPAFLRFLNETTASIDWTKFMILIQRHPGDKARTLDLSQVSKWAHQLIESPFNSDEAQIVADAALYYQTSMGPQFVLSRIPTIQVGHKKFDDILVRNHLIPSVSSHEELLKAIQGLSNKPTDSAEKSIFTGLGIQDNWVDNLKRAIRPIRE